MLIGETATNIETSICLGETLEVPQMLPQDVLSISLMHVRICIYSSIFFFNCKPVQITLHNNRCT